MEKGFLRDAIDRLVELAAPTTKEWDGRMFSSKPLEEITVEEDGPSRLNVNTLDALAVMIRTEGVKQKGLPLYIRVVDEHNVLVFTSLHDGKGTSFLRQYFYKAECDVPRVIIGQEMSQQQAIIQLQSVYGPTLDREYLLELISRMSVNEGVTSDDNGVTQTITARQGPALKENMPVKPIVLLQPYRTFLEVEQPASEFLLRVGKEGGISLHEADGGVWRLSAKHRIADWLAEELKEDVIEGKVIITI